MKRVCLPQRRRDTELTANVRKLAGLIPDASEAGDPAIGPAFGLSLTKSKVDPVGLRTVIQFVLICTLACIDARSFGAEFEVYGNIKYSPSGYSPYYFFYHVYVNDCKWAIFLVSDLASSRRVEEFSSDGDYIYTLDHQDTNLTASFQLGNYASANQNSWIGNLYRPGFPFKVLESEVTMLFYSYASSCYLNSSSNGMIGSVLFQPNDLKRGDSLSPALVIKSHSPPFLPDRIVWFDDLKKHQTCLLEVSAFTNVDGMQLPASVSLLRFFEDKTNILSTFESHVSNVKSFCSLQFFKPEIPGRCFIMDNRFSPPELNAPPIIEITTNTWPSIEESKLQPGYEVV